MKKLKFILMLTLLSLTQVYHAQNQRWIDANGTLRNYWKIGKDAGGIYWDNAESKYKVVIGADTFYLAYENFVLSQIDTLVDTAIADLNLDKIPDGTQYARILKTDVSAGHILLSSVIGNLDDIADGTTYGKVSKTSISAGKILLSEAIGSIDDINEGTVYGRVKQTQLDAGYVKITDGNGATIINGGNLITNTLRVSLLNNDLGWGARTKTYVQSSAPSGALPDDLWYDTSEKVLKRYTGSSWEVAGAKGTYIDATGVYTGTVGAQQIVAGSGLINNLNVLSTLTLGSASVAGTIETYNYASSPVGIKIQGGASPSITIKGGTFSTPELDAAIITSASIDASNISGTNIDGGTITGATITGGTIQTGTSNPKVIMDSSGLFGYDSNGNNTFSIPTATGMPYFKGGTIDQSNITASTITGGTIQTAESGFNRIVISGSSIYAYSSDGENYVNIDAQNANIKLKQSAGQADINVGTATAGYSDIPPYSGEAVIGISVSAVDAYAVGADKLYASQKITLGQNYFLVDANGNITKINNVSYSFPSSQGATNTYLRNDGNGNLSWSTVTASSITGVWGGVYQANAYVAATSGGPTNTRLNYATITIGGSTYNVLLAP